MKQMIDQMILLIYCMTAGLVVKADTTAVLVSFLSAFIFISADYVADSKKCSLAASILYTIAALFFPNLLLFYPVLLYSLLRYKLYSIIVFLGLLTVDYLLSNPLPLLLAALSGGVMACFLERQARSYERMEAQYKKARDDSTERSLLLEEKNKHLISKQDYQVYAATLQERNRIAREIHDNVGHMLSRSILMTGAMKMVNQDPSLTDPICQLDDTLNAAMDSVRESVHGLHDESVNLREALKSLADSFTFCKALLEYDMGYDVPADIKYSFIAIVKEGLNNVIRHSNATYVRILAREHPGLYQLKVEDNGSDTSVEMGAGIGLANIRDRISALNGTVQFHTTHGFCIFITIPKKDRGKV